MGKALILFYTNSGSTQKMAKFVSEGVEKIPGVESRLLDLRDADSKDLEWCDGLAFGAPTNYGGLPWKAKKWWDELPKDLWTNLDGKFGCVFSSGGSYGGGSEIVCRESMNLLINFGFLVFGVTDYVAKRFSPHYGALSAGSPESFKEQEACLRLGRRLGEWIAFYVDGKKEYHPTSQSYPRHPKDLPPEN